MVEKSQQGVFFGQILSITQDFFIGRLPVSERTLKKDDFPTFGRPAREVGTGTARKGTKKQTDDADLEIVTWPPEEDFLFLSGSLLGRHSLLDVQV